MHKNRNVTRGAQVLSHQNLHTYSKVQYITLHYTTVQYITLQYSTLQYIHAKDLEIVCHQRGTSPKSSERTYIYYITLQHNTLHPNTFFIFFNLFNCFKILSIYKSKEKNGKSQIIFEICFFEDGHKS